MKTKAGASSEEWAQVEEWGQVDSDRAHLDQEATVQEATALDDSGLAQVILSKAPFLLDFPTAQEGLE